MGSSPAQTPPTGARKEVRCVGGSACAMRPKVGGPVVNLSVAEHSLNRKTGVHYGELEKSAAREGVENSPQKITKKRIKAKAPQNRRDPS